MKERDIPHFGVLDGLKVVYSGATIAAPFGPALMADMGANVIWIEHYLNQDVQRTGTSYGYEAELDRRNQRTISLNIPSEKGRDIFLRLISDADIFIEGSRGGQWAKWGLTDEYLWEYGNPRLVIAHVSGYGQTGLPEYVGRGSYDPTAQAFGGLMYVNQDSSGKYLPVGGTVADYYTGYLAAVACLAGYIKAQKTGHGESFDVAQYEAVVRSLNHMDMDIWNMNMTLKDFNDPDRNSGTAGYNSFVCGDGEQVYMLALGAGTMKRLARLLDVGPDVIPEGVGLLFIDGREPDGHRMEEVIREYCSSRSAEQVEREMAAAGIPCSRVLSYEAMLDHPHYLARESLTTWETRTGTQVIGPNIFPPAKRNPGKIWRGCPDRGADNDDILFDLGYSANEIAQFYEDEVITKFNTDPVIVRREWRGEVINPEGV